MAEKEPMKEKVHVHVYKIKSMCELDILAFDKVEAKAKALRIAKEEIVFKAADCEFIALDVEIRKEREETKNG